MAQKAKPAEAQNSEVNVTSETQVVKIDLSKKTVQDKLTKEIKRQLGIGGKKGRPIDPTTKRQVILAERNEKKANGTFKLGRPAYNEAEKVEADKVKAIKKEAEKKLMADMAAELIASGKAEEIIGK